MNGKTWVEMCKNLSLPINMYLYSLTQGKKHILSSYAAPLCDVIEKIYTKQILLSFHNAAIVHNIGMQSALCAIDIWGLVCHK